MLLHRKPLCIVLDQDFSDEGTVLSPNGTFRVINMDGYGCTSSLHLLLISSNICTICSNINLRISLFVQNGMLYIVPKLTSDNNHTAAAVFDATVYDIAGCTLNIARSNNGYIGKGGGARI